MHWELPQLVPMTSSLVLVWAKKLLSVRPLPVSVHWPELTLTRGRADLVLDEVRSTQRRPRYVLANGIEVGRDVERRINDLEVLDPDVVGKGQLGADGEVQIELGGRVSEGLVLVLMRTYALAHGAGAVAIGVEGERGADASGVERLAAGEIGGRAGQRRAGANRKGCRGGDEGVAVVALGVGEEGEDELVLRAGDAEQRDEEDEKGGARHGGVCE